MKSLSILAILFIFLIQMAYAKEADKIVLSPQLVMKQLMEHSTDVKASVNSLTSLQAERLRFRDKFNYQLDSSLTNTNTRLDQINPLAATDADVTSFTSTNPKSIHDRYKSFS